MGIRIHTAIGWGLTPEEFKANSDLPFDGEDDGEVLYDALTTITSLRFPEMKVSNVYPESRGYVFQKDLLATDIDIMDKRKAERVRSAGDLHTSVYEGDGPISLELFFPNAIFAKSNFRYDDSIDYVEHQIDLDGEYGESRSKIIALKSNPYPYDQESKSQLAPSELRWWLTENGIIRKNAWELLRPYYAVWWC